MKGTIPKAHGVIEHLHQRGNEDIDDEFEYEDS